MSKYLDIQELAELLGQSTRTIRKTLVKSPHLVPHRLHLPGSRMLRWRVHEVESWMYETGVPGHAHNREG
jgi:predicted DNA-binding transcriptional regulator AlpA